MTVKPGNNSKIICTGQNPTSYTRSDMRRTYPIWIPMGMLSRGIFLRVYRLGPALLNLDIHLTALTLWGCILYWIHATSGFVCAMIEVTLWVIQHRWPFIKKKAKEILGETGIQKSNVLLTCLHNTAPPRQMTTMVRCASKIGASRRSDYSHESGPVQGCVLWKTRTHGDICTCKRFFF